MTRLVDKDWGVELDGAIERHGGSLRIICPFIKARPLARLVGDRNPQPFEVGTNGRVATGMSPDNTKSVTEVVFGEGRAAINLVFMNAPSSPPAPDFVLDVAHKQDAAVKSGLPS